MTATDSCINGPLETLNWSCFPAAEITTDAGLYNDGIFGITLGSPDTDFSKLVVQLEHS